MEDVILAKDQKKPRVWIINHHATTAGVGGNSRHFQIATELSNRGYDVTIFASSNNFRTHKYYFDEEYVLKKEGNVNVFWIKTVPTCTNLAFRLLNYINFYFKLRKKFNNFPEPDIVIGSSVHPFAWLSAYYICKHTNAQFIAEIRDIWPMSMKEEMGRFYFLARMLFEPIESFTYMRAEYIITTMQFGFEYTESRGAKKGITKWIPHGINLEEYDKNAIENEAETSSEILQFLKTNKCCVYTGALSQSEGLWALLEAASLMQRKESDIKFVIIGSGSEEEKLKNLISIYELKNTLMFPSVPSKQVPVILKYAFVLFCGLADKEVFAYGISKNKFYDYFAAKKPIVFASNVKNSIVDMAKAGFTVKAESADAIVDAIKEIEKMTAEEYIVLGNNARLFVESNHTNAIICNKFEELFRKLD